MTECRQKARPIDLGVAQSQPTLSQLLQHVVDTAAAALLTYLPNQQPNRERDQDQANQQYGQCERHRGK
jgi:hypothetical protein